MIHVTEEKTYPFIVQCWPPLDLTKRIDMKNWLDANVVWDGKLEIKMGEPPCGGKAPGRQNLHFHFRVHTIEDVGLIKMRC